ncbi:MAG: BrnT family toxin [Proteobacteria bacterium]|jgi:uncharacterized DUF497 family protein|nr:BrnT family toxin [Pseudomonadota bacterium]NLN61901.1 BrnT family toxin [Myxococcales bacterium]
MRFEWDSTKERANRNKHGIGFDEAKALFESETDYLEIFDDTHVGVEERFIAVGPIRRGLVVVVWTERKEEIIRMISARFATRKEAALYLAYMEAK